MLTAPTALVFCLACEDDVGGVLFREFILDGSDYRPGRRLLTVGTDCSAGKKYAALALERGIHPRQYVARAGSFSEGRVHRSKT